MNSDARISRIPQTLISHFLWYSGIFNNYSPDRIISCDGTAIPQSNLHTINTILHDFRMIVIRLGILRAAAIRFLPGGPIGSQYIDIKVA